MDGGTGREDIIHNHDMGQTGKAGSFSDPEGPPDIGLFVRHFHPGLSLRPPGSVKDIIAHGNSQPARQFVSNDLSLIVASGPFP